MRVINISLSELETKMLMIGFEGENQITQVRIDAAEILTDYPNATPTLIVKPLFGFAYPVIVAMEGTDVVWNIDNSVLSIHGDGEIQLTFTQGTVIAKSYVGRIRIKRSLAVNGEAPDPIETWEQAATAKLAEVDAQIGELEDMVEAAEAAKDQAQDIVDDAAADIQAAGAAQVQVVQAAGEEVLDSIPSDYSTLSGDVSGLKSALNETADPIVNTFHTSGSQYYDCQITAGDVFFIKNIGNTNLVIHTHDGTADVETVTEIIRSGETMFFTASQDATKFRVYFPSSAGGAVAIFDGAMLELYKDLQDTSKIVSASVIKSASAAGSLYYDQAIKSGDGFYFKNVGSTNAVLYTNDGSADVEQITNILVPGAEMFFLASKDATRIRCYFPSVSGGSVIIIYSGAVVDLYSDLKTGLNSIANPCMMVSHNASGGVNYTIPVSAGDEFYFYNASKLNQPVTISTYNASVVETVVTNLKPLTGQYFKVSEDAQYIRVYYVAATGGTVTICGGLLAHAIGLTRNKLADISEFEASAAGGVNYTFPFTAGKKYLIVNMGSGSQYFNAYTYNTANVETIGMDIAPGMAIPFIPSVDTTGMRIYYSTSQGGKLMILTGAVSNAIYDVNASIPEIDQPYPIDFDFNVSKVPEQSDSAAPTNDPNEIYAIYDALLAQYPNYITKIDCSEADSVLGITRPSYLSGYPIYLYKFTPKIIYSTNNIKRRLKIMILTGVHSDEKFNMFNVGRIMRMICENWKNDKNAAIMRTLVEFYIIPVVNPWGYAHMGDGSAGRTNGNGVNLNRNCATSNWVSGTEGANYGGPSGNSEYETKIWEYYCEQIKPDVFIDQHTPHMNENGEMGICACDVQDIGIANVGNILARGISNNMICEDANFPQNADTTLFDMYSLFYPGDCVQYAHANLGIRWAFLFEMSDENRWTNGVLQSSVRTDLTSGELIKQQMQNIYLGWMRLISAAALQISPND